MTDLDERLAAALREAVPAPPHQLDPETIRDRSTRHRQTLRRYAPALAAAVVVALAVGIAVTRGGGGTHKPANAGDPRDLFGLVWRVQTIDGQAPGRFQSELTLRIEPNGDFWQSIPICVGYAGRLSATRTELIVHSAGPNYSRICNIPRVQAAERHFLGVMRQVFVGHIAWSVDGDQLTLRSDGGPTIVYVAHRHLKGEPGTLTAEVVVDQTTAPANGEPIGATLMVDNETGAPIVISDACNGWYAVGLTNEHASFNPGWGQVACASDTLRVGLSRFEVLISTEYLACAMNPNDSHEPHCLGPDHNVMPSLPPGDYTTKVVFVGLSHNPTVAAPVHVTLTAP